MCARGSVGDPTRSNRRFSVAVREEYGNTRKASQYGSAWYLMFRHCFSQVLHSQLLWTVSAL